MPLRRRLKKNDSIKTSTVQIETKKPVVKTPIAVDETSAQPSATVLAEKDAADSSALNKPVINEPVVEKPAVQEVVHEPVVFNEANSRVYWQEDNDKTNLFVRAEISGPVKLATVTVGSYQIELNSADDSRFEGKIIANEPADNFFKVIIPPVIKIVAEDGQIIESSIDWYNIKIVSPSPLDTYFHAKDSLSPITNIFSVSRSVYLVAIVFFALALALNIFIEIKKQHYHIILQTLGLLGLLLVLFLI